MAWTTRGRDLGGHLRIQPTTPNLIYIFCISVLFWSLSQVFWENKSYKKLREHLTLYDKLILKMASSNYFLPCIHASCNVTLQLIPEILIVCSLLWPIECSWSNSIRVPSLNLERYCMFLLSLSWNRTINVVASPGCLLQNDIMWGAKASLHLGQSQIGWPPRPRSEVT